MIFLDYFCKVKISALEKEERRIFLKRNKILLLSLSLIVAFSLVSASTVLAKEGPHKKLSHGSPQSVGMDKQKLNSIDELVEEAIAEGITPGAVVLIAKNNIIIKEDAYGYASKYNMGEPLHNPKKMTIKTVLDRKSVVEGKSE